ncbi:hypothetical protein DFH06DRAFT_1015330, partial [Mycena polygramma]
QKSSASQTLRPVTIAQIRKATQANPDSDWFLDENAVGQARILHLPQCVTVVAELYGHNAFTTNRTFELDDGTGRIDAKMWTDTPDGALDEPWREPMYVRVTGSIKTYHGRKHIHASNVRVVSDAHELYFHLLDTVSVYITLKQGPAVPPPSNAVNAGGSGAPSAYMPPPAPPLQKPLFSVVADAVVHYLRTTAPHPEGVHVGDIAKALDSDAIELRRASCSAQSTRRANRYVFSDTVNRLIDEGYVFTTVDESHIQLAD